MKKRFLCAAAALAVLSCPVHALADTSVTLLNTITSEDWLDIYWVYDTNVLYSMEDSAYYLMSSSGERLSEAIYDYDISGYHDLVNVRLAAGGSNSRGVLDSSGREVIPFNYGYIDLYSENWIVAFVLADGTAAEFDFEDDSGTRIIDTADIYYYAEGTATKLASLTRDQIGEYYANGDYIAIENRSDQSITLYDSSFSEAATDLPSVYDDGGVCTGDYHIIWDEDGSGVEDSEGNLVFHTDQGILGEIDGNYATIYEDEHYGLISLTDGSTVIPTECDYIRSDYSGGPLSFFSAGYVCVEIDGKAAYYDLNGNLTMKPEYPVDSLSINGASALMTDAEGNVHLLAADGTDTLLDEKHQDPVCLYYSHGLLYTYTDQSEEYGVMDWHGNEVLTPPQGYNIGLSGDGTRLITSPDYNTVNLYAVDYDLPDFAQPDSMAGQQDAEAEESDAEDAVAEDTAAENSDAEDAAEDTDAENAGTEESPVPDAENVEDDEAGGAEPAAVTEDPLPDTGEEAAPAGETDTSAVKSLIDTALTLVNVDLAGNQDSVLSLLNSAKSQMGSDQAAAASILDSVISLISTGMGDASSAAALLQNVSTLLG